MDRLGLEEAEAVGAQRSKQVALKCFRPEEATPTSDTKDTTGCDSLLSKAKDKWLFFTLLSCTKPFVISVLFGFQTYSGSLKGVIWSPVLGSALLRNFVFNKT